MCCDAVKFRLSLACVIRLQTYTLMALEFLIALERSRTSRFGIRLVNSDPGPMVIKSAVSMAWSAAAAGFAFAGAIRNSVMRRWLAVMLVSPRTTDPSSMIAYSCALLVVAGRSEEHTSELQSLRHLVC